MYLRDEDEATSVYFFTFSFQMKQALTSIDKYLTADLAYF